MAEQKEQLSATGPNSTNHTDKVAETLAFADGLTNISFHKLTSQVKSRYRRMAKHVILQFKVFE